MAESNVMTIRTNCDRSWPLLKLVNRYSEYQKDLTIYKDENGIPYEVEVTFVLKKILGSTKLTRKIFIEKAKKELL